MIKLVLLVLLCGLLLKVGAPPAIGGPKAASDALIMPIEDAPFFGSFGMKVYDAKSWMKAYLTPWCYSKMRGKSNLSLLSLDDFGSCEDRFVSMAKEMHDICKPGRLKDVRLETGILLCRDLPLSQDFSPAQDIRSKHQQCQVELSTKLSSLEKINYQSVERKVGLEACKLHLEAAWKFGNETEINLRTEEALRTSCDKKYDNKILESHYAEKDLKQKLEESAKELASVQVELNESNKNLKVTQASWQEERKYYEYVNERLLVADEKCQEEKEKTAEDFMRKCLLWK